MTNAILQDKIGTQMYKILATININKRGDAATRACASSAPIKVSNNPWVANEGATTEVK